MDFLKNALPSGGAPRKTGQAEESQHIEERHPVGEEVEARAEDPERLLLDDVLEV